MRTALVVLLTSMLGVAAAESSNDGFDFELFRPSADPYGYFAVPSAATLGHLELSGGGWVNYENDPIILVSEDVRIAPKNSEVVGDNGEGIVDDRMTGNVQIGFGLSRYFSLSVDVPLVLMQDGYLPNQNIIRVDTAPDRLIVSGVGDVRVTPKLVALDRDRHPIGMSFAIPVGVPTGVGGSFLGEGGLSATPTTIFEFSDGSVRSRKYSFRSAVMAGYHIRPSTQIRDVPVGNAVVYGVAIGLHSSFMEVIGEFHGSIWGDYAAQQPAELLSGVKMFAGDYLSVNLGGGVGVLPGIGAPDWRAFLGVTVAARPEQEVGTTKPKANPVESELLPEEPEPDEAVEEPEPDDAAEEPESECERLRRKAREAAEAGDPERSRLYYQKFRKCKPPNDW